MADELQRQFVHGNDFVAHDVGYRHLGGGNQVELAPVRPRHREQILLEFRQLAGPAHAVRVDQIRHIYFGIAVLRRVHIKHELRERAMHTCQGTFHQGEARAADFYRGIEIEQAEPGTDVDMVLRHKIELARFPNAADLDILIGGFADRHAGMRQVRDCKQKIRQPGLNAFQLGLD